MAKIVVEVVVVKVVVKVLVKVLFCGEGGGGGEGHDGWCGRHPVPLPLHCCSISDPDWRDEISPAKIKRSQCQNNS